jgi:hypothetical protein
MSFRALSLPLALVWAPLAWANGTDVAETCDGTDENQNGLVDEGAVCTGCRQLNYEGRSYLICADEVTDRGAAATLCDGFGYHLVDLQSEAETDFLVSELDLLTTYWSGLTDNTPNSYLWSDGEPADFIPWSLGQPDDLTGDEGCAWLFAGSGAQQHGLNDVPCTADGAGAVCESDDTPFEPCQTGDTGLDQTGDTGVDEPPPAGHVICACSTGSYALGWLPLLALAALRRR